MGHSVGIPSLGEHRDRHNAANGPTKLARLANRIHNFAKELLIGNVVSSASVACPLYNFPAEPLNFVRSHATKIVVERIAGLQLLAIDKERVRAGQGIAGDLVKIAEQLMPAILQSGGSVFILAMETGM